MISMSQVNIDSNIIDFSNINVVQKGVVIYIKAGNTDIYIVSKTTTEVENWLNLIVATFNVKEGRDSTAVLDGKKVIFNDVNNIEMDLGFEDA